MAEWVTLMDRDMVAEGDSLKVTLDYSCWPLTCPTLDSLRNGLEAASSPVIIHSVSTRLFGTGAELKGTPDASMTVSELKGYLLQAANRYSEDRVVPLYGIGVSLVERWQGTLSPSPTTAISLAAIAVIVAVGGYLVWRFTR